MFRDLHVLFRAYKEPTFCGIYVTLFQFVLPYILESNPRPFYSFRGLKNQMRSRIACGLDSRS